MTGMIHSPQVPSDQASDPRPAPSPFPESDRVIYTPNPLVEVVCQLRFSPILKIDVVPPADFQESIRSDFPTLRDRGPDLFDLPPDIPQRVAAIVKGALSLPLRQAAFDFISPDGKWTLSLTRDFMALATSDYKRWEDFKGRLDGPFRALVDHYSPSFTRVGLRYQNLVRPEKVGLKGLPWSDLLQPHIIGMLASDTVSQLLRQNFSQSLIEIPSVLGFVTIRNGPAQVAPENTPAYIIDNDFFTERSIQTQDVHNALDALNQQSGRLFRWCITDVLHKAMAPELV